MLRIKSYIRRTRKGKMVRVKEHTRENVDKTSSNAPKALTPSERWKAGEEIELRKLVHGMSQQEASDVIAEWDRKMRENSLKPYAGKPKKKRPKSDVDVRLKGTQKKTIWNLPERAEDRIAGFVEKYSGKTYKRQL